jgi:hypothetical protein
MGMYGLEETEEEGHVGKKVNEERDQALNQVSALEASLPLSSYGPYSGSQSYLRPRYHCRRPTFLPRTRHQGDIPARIFIYTVVSRIANGSVPFHVIHHLFAEVTERVFDIMRHTKLRQADSPPLGIAQECSSSESRCGTW